MIFFYNASGTLIKVAPDHVYQGSDGATTLYFVAPIVSTAVVNVAFTLPNGERTAKHILTPYSGELNGVTDGNGNTYKVWAYDLDGHITAYAGNVAAQFFITISGVLRSTQAANFTVELGVPPVIEPPEPDSYDELMAYIQEVWAQLQADIDEKQDIIDDNNMLPSDYVTDENQTHKFVSAEEKATWNAKQNALTETQLNAVNSGIDSAKVAKIGANETAISNINGKIPSAASSSNKLVDTAQMQAFALPITTKYGANLTLVFNSANGILTAQLKDQDGNNLGQAQTVEIDLQSIETEINGIKALIPAQASAQNPLADKNFVNSSISTNTAHFIGTFNSLAELEAYSGTVTNNDYANVIRTVDGQTYYDRYTYNGNTEEWEFNFTVNSTSFTAVQWAAINSGITQSLVAAYNAHIADKNNPHEVSKAQVGLGNVDNTSDADKPVSTAQQAALNALKQGVENGDIVAGIAKQIQNVSPESGSYQDKSFLFQGTGTDSNTTETPTAPIAKHLELRGNTVIFNQLVDANTTEIVTTSGHKYLTNINGVKSIITATGETLQVTGGTDNVFDLTKMFGAGKEPTSALQFNRLFPLPYYAYNAGELKSCQSDKLITTGYNQFENLNQFIKVVAGQTYRLAYYDGTQLQPLTSGSIEEYDGSQTLIQTTTYNNLSDLHTLDNSYPDNGDKGIILTDETQWVKIVSSSNTNILFNLAWDGSRNDFETFVKHEYTLPNVELKSARNIYDSYYPDGTKIQRVATVDGGTIDWGYNSTWKLFYADFYIATTGIDNDIIGNVVCPIYDTVDLNHLRPDLSYGHDKGIALGFPYSGSNIRIVIRDDSYNGDTAAFKTAMSGVMINYELINSYITTTGNQTFPENIEVDDFGTMEFTSSGTESASNPIIPQGNRFFYPADYALLIDDLNNYTNGDVNVLAKKSDIEDIELPTETEIQNILWG